MISFSVNMVRLPDLLRADELNVSVGLIIRIICFAKTLCFDCFV